jgi:hypothetical protein
VETSQAQLRQAIAKGTRFLLERQDADGAWRDYALPPVGASDAWTTSYVGLTLAEVAPKPAQAAILHARHFLVALRRVRGWGYNVLTPCDADTTAWAVRFLGIHGNEKLLLRFLDIEGRARTYTEGGFGSWTEIHADVTPVVGMALLVVGAPPWIIARVRSACLRSRTANGSWISFWWTTHAYALARNLQFLAASGGIAADIAGAARIWLASAPASSSAFETAQLAEAAHLAGAPVEERILDLLMRQRGDGGWPASGALLLRDRTNAMPGEPYADVNRLFTTASALRALGSIASFR